MSPPSKAQAIPKEANWTSVTLTTNGLPDEVLAVAASYDDTLRYGAQTPFSDQLSFRWEGGMWQYDPYHNSIITGGNGGTKPTRLAFTIFYNQGTQRYDLEQTLQPDEQMWIDVGKLIREHVSDRNGKTLPADLTSGSYEFRDLTNIGVGTLFEGKVIYDKTYGHVAYGCGTCCGYYTPKFFYDPLLVPVGSTGGNGVTALDQCTQKYDDVSADFYGNWSSANTAIVRVDYYGTHTGVSAGSTTSSTSGWLTHYGHLLCPDWNPTPRGTANVKPTITSVSPARGLIGATTKSVTITGKGLSGGHVNTPAAIQVSNITTATDAQITFDAVISTTAIPGNNAAAIYVTVSGEDSNKVDFYVQVPTSLSIVAGSASKTNEVLCGAGACGTIPTFKYQVNDQDSPTAQPIRASMSMWDSFGSTFNPDGLHIQGTTFFTTCSPANTGPCNTFTNTDGTFTEGAIGACSTVCYANGACKTGGPSGIPQTWHIAGYSIVQQISEYCEKVLVNGTQVQ
jgi:hypothetical protein